jgi:hypothetical protein
MKQVAQWVCVLAGALYIGWTHAHTDEVPVVLGFILLISTMLGGIFPQRPWLTGLLLGVPPFIVENLVRFSVIHAPYGPSAGVPWAALLAFVPAMGGAFFGSAVRHLQKKESNPAG